jgi:hypothetical protein
MQKSLFLIIPLLLWGCEQTFDGVIDVSTENYQVTSVTHADSLDLKNPGDSVLTARIKFTGESQLRQVFFDVIASDNSVLNPLPIEMFDISNNLFSAQYILKRENPNGTYILNFTAKGTSSESKLVATSSFEFNNGQDNLPPVISNTVIEPDTAVVNDTTVIFTSVEAMDPNGANDIVEVYFVVYKPDGSTNNIEVSLFDDGNTTENGDLVAGDGIYSRLIQVNQANEKGIYRFEFQAKDRLGELSNIINHFVLIQ